MRLSDSVVVDEWMAEAERGCALHVLEQRFGRVPDDLHPRVAHMYHRPTLRVWRPAAVKCRDLDDFRARLVSVVVILECRFRDIPPSLTERLWSAQDSDTVMQWATLARTAATLDGFRPAAGL